MNAKNMTLRKLGLLMWKHYHLRKHHWFLTIVEIVLPVLLVSGIIKGGGTFLSAEGMTPKNATIVHTHTIEQYLQTATKFSQLVYTPNTKEFEEIVNKALEIWDNQNISPKGVDSERELEIILTANVTEVDTAHSIGVVFGKTANSKQFGYKIRDADTWPTDDLFPKEVTSGPYISDPYRTQGFAALQLALDGAFLEKMAVDFDRSQIKFQGFPYPEYNQENPFRSSIPHFVCILVIVTLLILSIPLINAVIEEKESGVKELMKIVGLQEWLIWTSWFLNALFFSLISFTVITYLLQHEFFGPHSAAIRCVYPSVLWSCIMLFCIANIAFCFTFTSLFHKPTSAGTVFFLAITFIGYGSFWVNKLHSRYLTRLTCVFPVGAFIQAFTRIQYFEVHDMPLGWLSLGTLERNTDGVSLGFAFLMLILDTILYLFLAYYITAINPGKFGARKSPLFIFERLRSRFKDNASQELVNLEDPPSDKYFEKPPADLKPSIKIKDLHKNFGSVYAVKGVNLDVFSGEITALLGHNGAGKTTTMAILTGLLKPTAGTIFYKNDLDVLNRMDEFRNNLGMCAQEDRLFPYLSVKNHLLFFGMLKGASKKEASQEANQYMRLMEIDSKANSLSTDLSGGMKRKLCLSIALMGKSEILILDEPTSGLDVESRRKLWDLLLGMRKNRTIILTTHHMEEADALGDRIAIMHHGRMECYGTSLFLKKAYGTGYHLTVTKHQDAPVEEITNIISTMGTIQDVTVDQGSTPTEVLYKLPLTETKKFPNMFRMLEERKRDLGIESMGISCTTMEQVFLKVGGVSVYDPKGTSRKSSTVTDGAALAKLAEGKKVGLNLIIQQVQALMKKKWLYTTRNLMAFVYRVVLTTFIVTLMLKGNMEMDSTDKPIELSLKTYSHANVMLLNNANSPYYEKYQRYVEKYGGEVVNANDSNSIIEALLFVGRNNLSFYEKELILAAEFNESGPLLLNNMFALHSLPISINTLSNILLQTKDSSSSISCVNHPVKRVRIECQPETGRYTLLILWFWALAFFSVDLSTYFTMLLNVERIDGFKHIQLMSSVSPLTYWLSNFIFDFLFFFVILLGRIVVFKVAGDSFGFLQIDLHFAILLLMLMLFIGSMLLFTYVLSFMNRSKEGPYTLLFIFNIIGAIVVGTLYLFQPVVLAIDFEFSFWVIIFYLTRYLVLLLPPLNYFLMFSKFFNTWYFNTACERCPTQGRLASECPKRPYLVFYSTENPDGILQEVLFAIVNLVLYSGLLAFIQLGYLDRFMNYIVGRLYRNTGTTGTDESSGDTGTDELSGDDDVKIEKAKVQRAATELTGHTTDTVLLAQELRKDYISWFRPFTAVADVNFTVKASECFGLLGVNGAGKSTTFKMLTADLLPTYGDASILGLKLSQNKTEYLSKAGYCAQSNCFLEQLSGREMLTLIASLRGIRSDHVKSMVDQWLSILGLEEYQNQHCGGYSGGNKRKLCTAMSLVGDPHVVFLDEPTSGVDPVSRRRLYTVMDQSKSSGQSVVLTSHSMEECENLCDRLTILVQGRMRCIGTAQHLKKNYAQGFSVLIKIPDTTSEEALDRLKAKIQDKFENQCILKDVHKTQLYYQITNVNLPWSLLFKRMEELKNENQHIDDYTLSDTSLEEVFISFAKQSTSAEQYE